MEVVRTWIAHQTGRPVDVLHLEERVAPSVVDNTILIKVEACGLALPDYLMTCGQYPPVYRLPIVPGQEAAGTVLIAPPNSAFAVGDRVMGITLIDDGRWDGGLAEVALLLESKTQHIPADWGFVEAAGFPVAFRTANCALSACVPPQPGQTLLVLGASGSTGSALIILGKALGATVIALASGKEKMDYCAGLGAHHVVDYRTDGWTAQVLGLTGGRGADVIVDPVGGQLGAAATEVIAHRGRFGMIGAASETFTNIDPLHMIFKSYSVHGVSDHIAGIDADRDNSRILARLIDKQGIRAPIGKIASFEDAPDVIAGIPGAPPGKTIIRMG